MDGVRPLPYEENSTRVRVYSRGGARHFLIIVDLRDVELGPFKLLSLADCLLLTWSPKFRTSFLRLSVSELGTGTGQTDGRTDRRQDA